MLGPVKNQDLAVYSKSGNNVWVLGLIACFVDLARVVDLLGDREPDCGGFSR